MKLPFGLGASEVVTLNLEGSDVRLLVADGSRVSLWAETELAPGLVREGLVVDTAAVGKAIDELLTDYGVSRKKVVTALTGLRAIPRIQGSTASRTGTRLLRAASRQVCCMQSSASASSPPTRTAI